MVNIFKGSGYTMQNFTVSLLLLFHSVLCFTAECQDIIGNDAQENLFKIGSSDASFGVVRKFDNRYEGVQGSPFYSEEWVEGSIVTEKNRQIDNVQLKYHVFEDELIINKNSGQFYLPKKQIKSFILKEKEQMENVHFTKLHHPKNHNEYQYYKIIWKGTISLFEHSKVVFEKANFEGGYSNDKRYDEFKKYPVLYYVIGDGTVPVKLKTTANGFSKIFPDHNDEVKKFISTNGYSCKNEQELIAILNYYEKIK